MQKKNILQKQRITGFTLIELLFSVSIMAIIFSVSFANLRGFQQRQHLDSAVKQIKADLRLTQEMALAGRKPTEPPLNQCIAVDSNLVGYQFVRDSGSQYHMAAVCTADPNPPVSVTVKTPNPLPTGVDFLLFGGNTILFYAVGRGTDKDPYVCLHLELGADDKYIIVTKTGDIVEKPSCTYP
jgi:prepilin-type N-terminal cleavage/methylation domain-containing protein